MLVANILLIVIIIVLTCLGLEMIVMGVIWLVRDCDKEDAISVIIAGSILLMMLGCIVTYF